MSISPGHGLHQEIRLGDFTRLGVRDEGWGGSIGEGVGESSTGLELGGRERGQEVEEGVCLGDGRESWGFVRSSQERKVLCHQVAEGECRLVGARGRGIPSGDRNFWKSYRLVV